MHFKNKMKMPLPPTCQAGRGAPRPGKGDPPRPELPSGAAQPKPEPAPPPASGSATRPLAPSWPPEPLPFLEAMNELSLHGVGIADRDGIIRYTNQVCQNIYGLKSEEIIGRHFREFYADSETLNEMLAQARTYGRVDNFPIMARYSDGSLIPVEVSLVRVQDSSHHLMGSVAVIHDTRNPKDLVSHMQKQEMALIRLNRNLELANLELERVNRLKDEFLANTSHELRTPLSAILGFLRIVLDKLCSDPAEEREFIQNAYDSASTLLKLINELLDTARIEAGKVELNLVKVEVSQVFEEVKKLSQMQAAQKGLRLTFQAHRVKVRRS